MKHFFFPLLAFALVLLTFAAPALASDLDNPEKVALYFEFAAVIVAAASAVANLTKTDKDNKAVGLFSRIVNLFALNFKRSGL
jgi:hypothetical protein